MRQFLILMKDLKINNRVISFIFFILPMKKICLYIFHWIK